MMTRVTAPSEEPVTLADAKSYMRIDDSDTDGQVNDALASARRYVESRTGRALVSQQWRWHAAEFPPSGRLYLPYPPLVSVDTVQYYTGDTLTDLDAAYYHTHAPTSEYGYMQLVDGYSWPSVDDRDDAVQVTYTCGFGTASEVPDDLKLAITQLAANFFDNPATTSHNAPTVVPFGTEVLLWSNWMPPLMDGAT